MQSSKNVVVKAAAEPRLNFRVVTWHLGHRARGYITPCSDDVGKILRIAIHVGDHERFHLHVVEPGIGHQPTALGPDLDVVLEVGDDLRDLVVGPLDAFTAWLAEAM